MADTKPDGGILRENLRCLRTHFPELAALLSLDTDEKTAALRKEIPGTYAPGLSRAGTPLLTVDGFSLHSKYDPAREAARALETKGAEGGFSASGCVFAGLGMGYYCLEYAAKYPDAFIAVIEPDIFIFLRCLEGQDMRPLLERKHTALFIGLSAADSAAAAEEITGKSAEPVGFFAPPALAKPNQAWFDEFFQITARNREKRGINKNTLKRFGKLWLKNIYRNLGEIGARAGISCFKNLFAGFPVILLAAGPSLDRILPQLKILRGKCLLVAVDTALRACLKAGVQPDFVVLVDPQYWNYRHIAGLKSGGSFLITESAAYPAVFRFAGRKTALCASLFPPGKFLEARTGEKDSLGAGGSVATTAWDFARYTGANPVYAAGLDLGYPGGATHFRGALFEEKNLSESGRLFPAETGSAAALLSGGPFRAEGYGGEKVLTDRRLNLYAWWFEAAAARHPETETFVLDGLGVKIPGMDALPLEALFSLPERRGEIDALLDKAENAISETEKACGASGAFRAALRELSAGLKEIILIAEKGEARCERFRREASQGKADVRRFFAELNRTDAEIQAHPMKDILSMVFEEDGAGTESRNAADGTAAPDAGRTVPARRLAPQLEDAVAKSLRFYGSLKRAAQTNLEALEAAESRGGKNI